VVWLAGLLNLPYYLALIATTAYLSDEVMKLAENSVLLFSLLGVWLAVALFLDINKHRKRSIA
jgi:membrane-associated protein